MDVRCEKCQTVYEFDDARVKDSGVTVKCTQCGHIFKVKKRPSLPRQPRTLPGFAPISDGTEPPEAAGTPPPTIVDSPPAESSPTDTGKVWLLRHTGGEVRRFRDLTTLQQWIVERKAFRDDEISRTGDRWKSIGTIPELEPFFRIVDQATKANAVAPRAAEPGPANYGATVEHEIVPTSEAFNSGPATVAVPTGQRAATVEPPRTAEPQRAVEPRRAPEPPREPAGNVSDSDDLEIPRQGPPVKAIAIGAALLAVGALAFVGFTMRDSFKGHGKGEPGGEEALARRAAWQKGRDAFLLDTDEDFQRAEQQLKLPPGSEETSPLVLAALVELDTTWARHLRDDARLVEKKEPARAEQLRRTALERLDAARGFVREAQALAPGDADVNRAAADFLCLDGAPTAQVDEALKRSETARPGDPELTLVRGLLAARDGKPDEAQRLLADADAAFQRVTHKPLVRAEYQLALVAGAAGHRADAEAAIKHILEASPRHARAAALAGSLDALAAAPTTIPDGGAAAGPGPTITPLAVPTPVAAAPADAGVARPAEPKGYESLVAAGDRLLERGKGKEAVKMFEKALAEQPDGVEAQNGLAYAYLDTEHYNAAADQFRKVLAAVPGNGDAIIGLAETFKMRGDKAQALAHYRQYLVALPGGSKAQMARANVEELEHALKAPGGAAPAEAHEVHEAPSLPPPPPAPKPAPAEAPPSTPPPPP